MARLRGGIALALGQESVINLASVVSALATLVAMILVFVLGDHLLRFVVEHVVLAGGGFAVVLAALVAVGLPFDGVILGSAPAAWVLGAGLSALMAFGVYRLLLRRSGKDPGRPTHTTGCAVRSQRLMR